MDGEGKLEGLQIGRALAALTVAYFHSYMIFNNWPQAMVFPIPGLKDNGYLGVNFFFAISGYVIGVVCDRPNFSVKKFVTKRFFRLYPVYWVILIAIIMLKVCGVFMPTSYKFLNIIYSMTLLPHGEDVQPFLAVTWSLEFEIMFYFLAVLTVPVFGVWGLAAVLYGLVYWTYHHYQHAFSFHLLRTLNADFLAGVLAYLLRKPLSYIPTWILIPVGVFGYYNAVSGWLIPFAGSYGGFVLVSGLANAKWPWQARPFRWLITIGDASYSLYLIHFVVIWVFVALTGRIGTPPARTAEAMRVVYLGTCVWLAIKAYQYIERPMIKVGNRLAAQPWRIPVRKAEQPFPAENISPPQTIK